jgi:hypothetical protein
MNSKIMAAGAVAVVVALVFAGIGYAAYSAVLVDNEETTADNNFVTLTLGAATAMGKEVDIVYEYEAVYTNGVLDSYVYKPYLVNALPVTDDTVYGKATLGIISVEADNEFIGSETQNASYTLAISDISIPDDLTDATISVYADEALTQAASMNELSYGTSYYVALNYVHNDADNKSGTDADISNQPDETLDIAYKLTATANIVAV